jgi:hypothetical protein
MRLASLKAGRDGALVVVSRDLERCAPAERIAPTLQAALEGWAETEPRLRALADKLEAGRVEGQRFDQEACAAPLPRAYQWLDGSAYVTHVELVRKARGAELPEHFWSDPLMYQGASDRFVAPRDPIEARPRGRGGGDHGRRADGRLRRNGWAPHQARDAGQRRQRAGADPARARQGLRLRARQARFGVLARGSDSGRAR